VAVATSATPPERDWHHNQGYPQQIDQPLLHAPNPTRPFPDVKPEFAALLNGNGQRHRNPPFGSCPDMGQSLAFSSMKQILLICAVVALVGCGGGVKCFWCKETIKENALICKHCGKDPSENGAEQAPDRTKRPVDTWVSKRHKKQVKIIDVLTNVKAKKWYEKWFVIKGTASLSTEFERGTGFSPERDYAFEIRDGSGVGVIYAYGGKDNKSNQDFRKRLLNEPSGKLRGFFLLMLETDLFNSGFQRGNRAYALFLGNNVKGDAVSDGNAGFGESDFITEKPSKGAAEVEAATDRTLIEKRLDGLFYVKGKDTPFTGTSISHHGNGEKHELESYLDGKWHGRHWGWHANGNKSYMTFWQRGIQQKQYVHYHPNGQIKFQGIVENGKPKLGSKTTIWDKDGNIISEVIE
jgi:hypothetical protein